MTLAVNIDSASGSSDFLDILFFFLNQQFITRSMRADRGSYFDPLLLLGRHVIQGKMMKLRLESMSFLKKQFNGIIVRESSRL